MRNCWRFSKARSVAQVPARKRPIQGPHWDETLRRQISGPRPKPQAGKSCRAVAAVVPRHKVANPSASRKVRGSQRSSWREMPPGMVPSSP